MKPLPLIAIAAGGALFGAAAMYLAAPSMTAPVADAAPAEPAEADAGPLDLDAEAQQDAGIALATLAPATHSEQRSGYARALDLSPLAAIASEMSTARAALTASEAEAARLAALAAEDQSASQREVEAARAQATADRARLTLACDRVALEYGAGLRRIGCGAIPGLVARAAAGNAALLRIDISGTSLAAGSTVEVGDGASAARVRVLGPAAAGEAQLQTAGALALVDGRAAGQAQIGRVLPAHVSGGSTRAGVIVPREALVFVDGGSFVYRATGKGFARVAVPSGATEEAGMFVPTGALKPGDRIAIAGAGTLLGLERGAPAAEE